MPEIKMPDKDRLALAGTANKLNTADDTKEEQPSEYAEQKILKTADKAGSGMKDVKKTGNDIDRRILELRERRKNQAKDRYEGFRPGGAGKQPGKNPDKKYTGKGTGSSWNGKKDNKTSFSAGKEEKDKRLSLKVKGKSGENEHKKFFTPDDRENSNSNSFNLNNMLQMNNTDNNMSSKLLNKVMEIVKKIIKKVIKIVVMNLLYILAPLILVVLIIFTLIFTLFSGKNKGSSTVDSSNKIVYEFMNGDTSYEEICKVYPVDKVIKKVYQDFYEGVTDYIEENNTDNSLTDTKGVSLNWEYVLHVYLAYEMTVTDEDSIPIMLIQNEDMEKFLKEYITIEGINKDGIYTVTASLMERKDIADKAELDKDMFDVSYDTGYIYDPFIFTVAEQIPSYDKYINSEEETEEETTSGHSGGSF